MPSRNQMIGPARQRASFASLTGTGWFFVRASALRRSGTLVSMALRLASGGTGGNVNVALINGPYRRDTIAAALAAGVPEEHIAFYDAARPVVASATVSTQVNIATVTGGGATYARDETADGYELFLAVQGDGTLSGDLEVSLAAKDASV